MGLVPSPGNRPAWYLCRRSTPAVGIVQSALANSAYNSPGSTCSKGNLNREALQEACSATIARHESLRTIFKEDELGEVRQFVLPPAQAYGHRL